MYRTCYLLSKKYVIQLLSVVLINISAFILSTPCTLFLLFLHCIHFVLKWIILFVQVRSKESPFSGLGLKMLRGEDCGWLEKTGEESILQAVLVFDSKIDVFRIQELITQRVIPSYPRLTHKICPLPYMAGSVHCWLPDNNFNIKRHVFTDHVNLSNDQLQMYLSQLVNKKLTSDKPPWELRIVSKSVDCSSTDTIVILRVHQSLADGMTLIKMLCTKLDNNRASYTAFKNFKLSYYVKLIQAVCIGPALILYKLIKTYKDQKHPLHDEENNCSINWSRNISLCKIERIKQVTRSSYNCVFLSAVAGGLRCVLQSSGIKHPPDLKITLPFSIGETNKKSIPVSTFVPVSMEGAIPRLWQTKHQLKLLNSSTDLLITSFVINMLIPLCPELYVSSLMKFLQKSVNVLFSSVVGPTTRLVFDGSPLKTIYPLMPCQSDLGISVALSTYVDQVYVTVMSHNSLNNIGKMLLYFVEEQLDKMYTLLVNRTIPEDLGEDLFQTQLPDISELPIIELKLRMQAIQHELQRLSEMLSYNEDDVKRFSHFKSEFNHIFKEIRRRKSVKIRRPSVFTQAAENITSICSSRKSVRAILYPFKSELCEETKIGRTKMRQINFEEALQMMFYKRCPTRSSFSGCKYSCMNKYIYLSLVNANVNISSQKIMSSDLDEIAENNNFIVDFSKNGIKHQSFTYEIDVNEQII